MLSNKDISFQFEFCIYDKQMKKRFTQWENVKGTNKDEARKIAQKNIEKDWNPKKYDISMIYSNRMEVDFENL